MPQACDMEAEDTQEVLKQAQVRIRAKEAEAQYWAKQCAELKRRNAALLGEFIKLKQDPEYDSPGLTI